MVFFCLTFFFFNLHTWKIRSLNTYWKGSSRESGELLSFSYFTWVFFFHFLPYHILHYNLCFHNSFANSFVSLTGFCSVTLWESFHNFDHFWHPFAVPTLFLPSHFQSMQKRTGNSQCSRQGDIMDVNTLS